MNTLNYYIFKQTTTACLIVFFSIAGLLLVTGVADEAARKVNENYSIYDAILFKAALIPNDVYSYIGVIIMLGTLTTVASLNKHQELTIIQLTSTSIYLLSLKLLLPALIFLPVIFLTGEWIAPNLLNHVEKERAILLGKGTPNLRGQWFKADQTYLHADFIGSDGELVGITRFNVLGQKLTKVSHSKTATFESENWLFNETNTIDFTSTKTNVVTATFSNWENKFFTPQIASNLSLKPSYLTLPELMTQVNFRRNTGSLTPDLERTLWKRILFPMQYIALLFVGLGFAFGSFRQKTIGDSAFKALVIGVVAGLSIDTFSSLFMIAAIPSPLAVFCTQLLFLLGAILFFLRKSKP